MFPSQSPYNYTFNNPLIYTDPTGMAPEKVKPKGDAELQNIKNTLTKEDAAFVQLDGNGNINPYVLNLREGSESGNFEALQTLVNSETTYHSIIADSYESADTDKPQQLVGDGSNGTKGVTLFPGAETDRSPDNDVYIYTSVFLSDERKAENSAHEGFGHAYFYELGQQGQNVSPNHQYEATLIETNPDAENYLDRYSIGRKDVNTPLVKQIDAREKEAVNNFRSRKNN